MVKSVNACEAVAKAKLYLKGEVTTPFFAAFDGKNDLERLRNELSSCEKISLSSFCEGTDAKPDVDRLFDHLRKPGRKSIILGVGEYSELVADNTILNRLLSLVLPDGGKLIVPIWNGYSYLSVKRNADPRNDEKGIAVDIAETGNLWKVKKVGSRLPISVDCNGFKALLAQLEGGCARQVTVKTEVLLSDKWVTRMEGAFAAYREIHPECRVQETVFTEEQWTAFLDTTRVCDNGLESADSLLKFLNGSVENAYLRFVVRRTEHHSEFRDKLLCGLLECPVASPEFVALYNARKELMRDWMTEERAAEYIRMARRFDSDERIVYLTDGTLPEKMEILRCIADAKTIPLCLGRVWKDLADYLFSFRISTSDTELGTLLDSYFTDYKRNKVTNTIPADFLDRVCDIAAERPYYKLPTRGSLVDAAKGNGVTLYWLDALGCEYLGFVQVRAKALGLRIKVSVGRANLPTLTSANKSFWDEWNGAKEQSKELDETKHGNYDDLGIDRGAVATGLVRELEVLGKVMQRINALLHQGTPKVVLASDHGATRLAVISGSETVWEMPEKGKHGGRCCPVNEFDGNLPKCVTDSDDGEWHTLANYDRFKGGRKADVEVHGGATIEEIVVPVIEFTLLDSSVKVELLTKEIKSKHTDESVSLEFFSEQGIPDFAVEFRGKRYSETSAKDGKHRVVLPKPEAGEWDVAVLSGDTIILNCRFALSTAGVTIKKDDDFFN